MYGLITVIQLTTNRTSIEDNAATFFMTNMMPQTPDNNRNTWGNLEDYSRELVSQGKELYIPHSAPWGVT